MKTHQFTIRDVPDSVSRVLRRQARERGLSLNRLLVELLRNAAGVANTPARRHDLDHLAGTWVHDPAVDRALAEQRKVDERDWR